MLGLEYFFEFGGLFDYLPEFVFVDEIVRGLKLVPLTLPQGVFPVRVVRDFIITPILMLDGRSRRLVVKVSI